MNEAIKRLKTNKGKIAIVGIIAGIAFLLFGIDLDTDKTQTQVDTIVEVIPDSV